MGPDPRVLRFANLFPKRMTFATLSRHGSTSVGSNAPASPYVVKASMADDDVARVRDALVTTFNDSALETCREQLLLKDISLTQQEDYWLHEAFSEHALKRGFSMVH